MKSLLVVVFVALFGAVNLMADEHPTTAPAEGAAAHPADAHPTETKTEAKKEAKKAKKKAGHKKAAEHPADAAAPAPTGN